MDAVIIYASKYGATAQYARWAGDELALPVFSTTDADHATLSRADYVILGSPVYFGKLKIRKWLEKNEFFLRHKKLFFFIVGASEAEDVVQRAKIITSSIPASLLGRQDIFFLPGRVIKEKLSRFDRFMVRMGALLERNKMKKAQMKKNIDKVSHRELEDLIRAVDRFTCAAPVYSEDTWQVM